MKRKSLLFVNIRKVKNHRDSYRVYDKKGHFLGEMHYFKKFEDAKEEFDDWVWIQQDSTWVTAEMLGEIQNALLYLYTVENLKES